MTSYFGDAETQRLQRKSDGLMGWIMETPGACVTGRMIAADDWRKLGWNTVETHLQEDGMFGFRWTRPDTVADLRKRFDRIGGTLFDWVGFMGDGAETSAHAALRLSYPLAPGVTERIANPSDLKGVQAFLARHGIAPVSSELMGGTLCPAQSWIITDDANAIVAAGFVGMLQNRFSTLSDCAWMGLIAVDPASQGKGFGSRLTALLCHAGVNALGANRVMAFAAADNAASIAMLKSAGLSQRSERSCVGVLKGGRPTR